jgi:iron complex outermembrane receptor protein
MTNIGALRLSCATAGLMLAVAAPCAAQTANTAGPSANDAPEDIIVTAQRRAERLIEVPVAVTALSGEALANQQVRGIDTLQQLVPSLTFTQSTNDLNNNVRIRGVGTALFNVGLESSVSIVVDGVVLSRQGQGFQDLIDIERVEVLRGPQGILFGKNATAGVINVVTKRPSDTLTFEGEGVIAELDEYRLRASVSGPLGETAGFRVTGFWNDVGGHIRNVATGQDFNGGQSYGVRGKVEFKPSERLDLLLIGDYRKSEADCCQFQARSLANPVALALLAPIVPSPTNTRVENDGPTFNNTEQWGASLEANLELGDHTLTSISAYRSWDFANNIDVDGLNNPQPLFLLPLVASGIGQFNINGGTVDIRQFSQELRVASPTGGLVEYVAGLFYFNIDLDRSFDRRVFFCLPGGANGPVVPGQPCAAPQPRSTFHTANTRTENYAAFGQLTLNLTEQLSLLGGFRLQREEVSYRGARPGTGIVAGDLPLLGASSGSASVIDDDLSLRGGVQYAFARNAQAYFTYTQGYKGRGYDVEITANFATQEPVRPETVDAFELGFKGATADGRLSANIALFHQKYRDLQVQATTQVNGLNQFVQTNAGSSISKGVEMEFAARPSDRLSVSGGITYLKADVNTTGTNCSLAQTAVVIAPTATQPFDSCFRFTGEAAGLNRQNIRDGRLPNAPSYRLNLTGRYEAPVTDGIEAFVQSSVNMQSDAIFALDQDPATIQDGFVTVDASIGVKGADNRYQLTLFVRNIFDEEFANSIFRDAFFAGAASPNNISQYLPKEANRYVGASLRVSF